MSVVALAALLAACTLSGCRMMNRGGGHAVTGGVEVADEQVRAPLPARGPRTVYVADFALDAADFQGDQGVRGMLPGAMRDQQSGLGERLPHPFATDDPQQAARAIVDGMSDALVQSLTAKGLPAQRLADRNGPLPTDGWLLQGMFTEVGEGNRFRRAIIGFGQGATSMDVQVGVSDLAAANPRAAFIVFGTIKDPSKLPGAVVTMNPYVAAAKFVLEKNATARDIRQTADQIVGEIMKYQQQIRDEAATRHKTSNR